MVIEFFAHPEETKATFLTLCSLAVLPALVSRSPASRERCSVNPFEADDGNLIEGRDLHRLEHLRGQSTGCPVHRRRPRGRPTRWQRLPVQGHRGLEATTADRVRRRHEAGQQLSVGGQREGAEQGRPQADLLASTTGADGHTYLDLAWVRIPQNTTSPSAHVGLRVQQGHDGVRRAAGLVQRTAGDMLIVYDFEGGATDTPTLTLRRWVTSRGVRGRQQQRAVLGAGGQPDASGFAEAKVNTGGRWRMLDAASALVDHGDSVPRPGDSEFGEAGIDLTAAGVFPSGACDTSGTRSVSVGAPATPAPRR